jgi:hypothetical protein
MSEDTLKKLGKIHKTDQGRDAVHVAIISMQAKHGFRYHAGLAVDNQGNQVLATDESAVGIIDPFLFDGEYVDQGGWFYVYLKPGTISSLKHVWTHPAFPDPEEVVAVKDLPVSIPVITDLIAAAKKRVEDWVDGADIPCSYDEFIQVLTTGKSGDVENYRYFTCNNWAITCYGHDAYANIPSNILDDVELIIGHRLTNRPEMFSCSC